MRRNSGILAGLGLVFLGVFGNTAVLQATSPEGDHHVRAVTPELAAAIADGEERSPSFRALVSALEQSDVVAYVQCEAAPSRLRGRLTFMSATSGLRYLLARVSCRGSGNDQIDAIAHELWHVSEVAQSADVVDGASFERLYSDIGFTGGIRQGSRTYDTEAANEYGHRVRDEVSDSYAER